MKMNEKERELYNNLVEMLNAQVVARYNSGDIVASANALNLAMRAIEIRVELENVDKRFADFG